MGNVKIIVALRAILINNFKFEKLRNRKIEEKENSLEHFTAEDAIIG